MKVQLITKPGPGITGTSRYTGNLVKGLKDAEVDVELTFPQPIPTWEWLHRRLIECRIDARAFFGSYPLRIDLRSVDLYHITTQTMATLLMSQRFDGPVVVTVLDIIPYILRHDRKLKASYKGAEALFYRLALEGLKRAEALITISEYTKKTVVNELDIASEKIHVVYPAVDHKRFHPQSVPDTFWTKYKLDPELQYILYVGSEDPRKNVKCLVEAFAQVRRELKSIKLLKVGAAHFTAEHEKLVQFIKILELQDQVLFFDQVQDEDLPLFYNAADMLVIPSLYEGFGLPALEAMACGTAVVCSNSGSLPEVVGDAAVLVDPLDTKGWANKILFLLSDTQEREHYATVGYERSSVFTWQKTALETKEIYINALRG